MGDDARAALAGWEADRPTNYYEAAPDLGRALRAHLGDDGVDQFESRLSAFGATVAEVVDASADVQERAGNGPRLVAADALGRACQQIEFHPAHAEAGRAVWKSGLVAAPAFEQAALMILLAHAGEAGQACPFACTAGLVRALRVHGSAELQARFLPPLLESDYDQADRGA